MNIVEQFKNGAFADPRTFLGAILYIMASQTTVNLTNEDRRVICTIPIGISYDSDLDRTRSILLELASHHPNVQTVRSCQITQLKASSVTLTLEVWCTDALTAGEVKSNLLEQAIVRFDREEITFPAQTDRS